MNAMLLIKLASLFLAGLVGGLYGASVGSGSLVTLPFLILFGIPIHSAVATNRFSALFLEIGGAARYLREKTIPIRISILVAIAAAIGAFFGAHALVSVPENVLNILASAMLLLVLFFLLFHRRIGMRETGKRRFGSTVLFLLTLVVGIYGGFFGAGFGTFLMMILVLHGLTFVRSASVSRVAGVFESLVATILFVSHGLVYFQEGVALAAGTLLGAWMGAGVAVRKGNPYVRLLLILIILLSVGKLMWKIIL